VVRNSASDTNAGKKGRCPRCKNEIIVPDAQPPKVTVQQNNSVHDSNLLDMPEKGQIKDACEEIKEPKRETLVEELEIDGESKLPWIIDIFLYPINTSGLIHLVIFSFLPQKLLPLFSLGYWFHPPIFGLGFLVIYISYFLFCLSDYIYESSKGNRRVPDSKITTNIVLHIEELLYPILNMFICIVVCFSPLLAYSIITKRIDFLFWLFVTYGSIFLPMILLAVVLFDSFWVLNPIFIVGSIFKVFLRYCGLVLLLCGFGGLIALLVANLLQRGILGYIFGIVCIYITMIMAHLLGRFYWRNKDKLGWGI
jgi:hypothetical protein